jgi:hypothetical protein
MHLTEAELEERRKELREQIAWAQRVHDLHDGAERTLIQLLAGTLKRTTQELLDKM